MSNKSGISDQIISLPKGGGALKGIGEKFSPDLHTGTGNFTVPITLPPGRNGFQPQLSLNYSTGTGNGAFGLGWNMSIPGVSRKASQGTPVYDDSEDTFILSGAEDLVPVEESGREPHYRPRTEGLFARIYRHQEEQSDYWEVQSKDGLVSLYGTPGMVAQDPAAVADPSSRSKVFAWKLARTTDPFGNRIVYEYERDLGQDRFHHWDQLYPKRIRYMDYDDQNDTRFLVSVAFEYDDRPDPFSDYSAGFEIRTRKRCKRVKIYTHAEADRLVRTYELIYLDDRVRDAEPHLAGLEEAIQADPTDDDLSARRVAVAADLEKLRAALPRNGVSVLSQVRVVGHDGERSEELPALEFGYTRFEPQHRNYQPFSAVNGDVPGRSLAHKEYELVDLFGNGLPSVFQMNGTTRYWRNLGGGVFDLPRTMQNVPASVHLEDPGVQIADVNGDGRADLLVTDGLRGGYYPLTFRGEWDSRSYRRYEQLPAANLEDPEVRLVDLDGDSVVDALRTGPNFELYYNDGHGGKGWEDVELRARKAADVFPDVSFRDQRVKLADVSGGGLQDIVLIHSGRVDYWPYLGYGRWARRITMSNSPRFEDGLRYAGVGYDPKRLLLGDVDGDGLADLVYVGSGHITLWINQSGNGWSDPITIEGTPPITDMDAVRLADMHGTGTAGILWTYDYNAQGDSTYKFLDLTGAIKPYLLNEMDNHMGAVTRVEYASSTRFYREDQKRSATRWKTPLPFPVQVVARVETIDQISKGKLTTEYRYHHGYWDGVEREFRGFGMVEQFDTEGFERYNESGLHGAAAGFAKVENPELFSPPTLTKTWFHQGPVDEGFGQWREPEGFDEEFWEGDPRVLPDLFDGPDPHRDLRGRVRRDALRTLRGRVLRTELYALDGAENRQSRPYTVTEYLHSVREESRPDSNETDRRRIFFPHTIGQRTTHWERGDDPMTRFTLTEDYDAYGQPRSQITVGVPRGRNVLEAASASTTEPYLVTQTLTDYAQKADDQPYIVNRTARTMSCEILNDGSAALAHLLREIRDGTANKVIIGQTLNFYDGEAFTGLPFGRIGDHGALVRTETLTVTEKVLGEAYPSGDRLLTAGSEPPYWAYEGAPEWPQEYPSAFGATLPTDQHVDTTRPGLGITPLKYGFSEGGAGSPYARGYFVATERRSYDFHNDSNGEGCGLVTAKRDALGNDSKIDYDSFRLMPTWAIDAVGLTSEARYDYRVLQPNQTTDSNGNRTEYFFTPLGLLRGTNVLGKQGEGDGIQIASQFQGDLDNGALSSALRQELEDEGISLSVTATVQVIEAGRLWLINDGGRTYVVRKTGTRLTVSGQPLKPSTLFEYNFKPFVMSEIALRLQGDLDNSTVTTDLQQELERDGVSLSADAAIRVIEAGNLWLISDEGLAYTVEKAEDWLTVEGQPVSVRAIRRVHHANDTDVTTDQDETIEMVEYSDGFGRLLQTRTQAEDIAFGDLDFGKQFLPPDQSHPEEDAKDVVGKRWPKESPPRIVVSGWQVYDNKGRVVEKYEPFFSEGWVYVAPSEAVIGKSQKARMFYDPRGQVIRTVNPDGSEQRVVYGKPVRLNEPKRFVPTPWEAYTYDANDNAGRTHTNASADYKHHRNTPTSAVADALGRTVETVERNRAKGDPLPPVKGYRTRSTYDIRGNLLTATDALQREAFRYVYDLANRVLRSTSHLDAGVRRTVLDAAGNTIEQRDSKGALILHDYDVLRRPVILWARDDKREGSVVTLRESLAYGDGGCPDQPPAEREANRSANRLGRLYRHHDEAGFLTFEDYDFKGNVLEKARQVISDEAILDIVERPDRDRQEQASNVDRQRLERTLKTYVGRPSKSLRADYQFWADGVEDRADELLDSTVYQTTLAYDALNRTKKMQYPEGVDGNRKTLRPKYNRAGALERVTLEGEPLESEPQMYVKRIAYNAKGQRMLIAYGNGVMTRYAYDGETFRLVRMRTERYAQVDSLTYRPEPSSTAAQRKKNLLQDFAYEHDLVGNVLKLLDRTPDSGVPVRPNQLDRTFEYDALYRLLSASGREHAIDQPMFPWSDEVKTQDVNKVRRYTETYVYDRVGNMEQLRHAADGGGFTRTFVLAPSGNRLGTLSIGDGTDRTFAYSYDDNGNLVKEGKARHFEWDHGDRMRVFYRTVNEVAESSVHVHYLYDSSGQRVKKLVRKQGQIEVTVNIDGLFEHHQLVKGNEARENNTLHVLDNQNRIALVRVGDALPDDGAKDVRVRYQLGDHLGSSNVVVGDSGTWINREEYTPLGESSFGSFVRKRYRFTGKGRDEESGLYYHGTRYYAPWLAKWVSCDPVGMLDGLNLYAYTRCNPIRYRDPSGNEAVDTLENLALFGVETIRDLAAIPVNLAMNRVEDVRSAVSAAEQGNWMEAAGWATGMNRALEELADKTEFYKQSGASTAETIGLLVGDISGMNDVMEAITGETITAKTISAPERIQKGIVGAATVIGTAASIAAPISPSAGGGSQVPAGRVGGAAGGGGRQFEGLTNAEIDAALENRRLGPLVQAPAKGMTGSGPKLGSSPDIWFHDNLRVQGVRGAPGGRPVNIRVHSENLKHPGSGYTMQINTHITNEATQGPSHYMTPEGTWHPLDFSDQELMKRLHIPAGN